MGVEVNPPDGAVDEYGKPLTSLAEGEYVFATKYRDGDPMDGYAIGFFAGYLPKGSGFRYMVVDSEGRQFRGNGFRRVERISADFGEWLVKNRPAFEALSSQTPINAWRFKYRGERARHALERWASDEGLHRVTEWRRRWFGYTP